MSRYSIDFADRALGALAARFSRTGAQTGRDTSGDLEFVTSGNPAFDNVSGLILEDARTNVILQSESTTGWTNTALTANDDNATGPDGTTSAVQLVDTSASSTHIFRRDATESAGQNCFSAYIKDDTSNRNIGVIFNGGGGALWDPTDGSLVTQSSSDDNGTLLHGNGWYRAWTTDNRAGGTTNMRVYLGNGTTWLTAWVGDDASGNFVYGVQVELGTFPSTYIPTTTGTATRNTCDLDDIDVSTDLGLSDPTNDISFHIAVKVPFNFDVDKGADTRIMSWFASATNSMELYFDQTTDQIHLGVVTAGAAEEVASTVSTNLSYSAGDVLNIRGKKDSGGISLWVNSETQVNNTNANAQAAFSAALTTAALNEDNAGANKGFVTVRGLTLYDTAESDSALNGLAVTDFGGAAIPIFSHHYRQMQGA